jgi:hypothetical protein
MSATVSGEHSGGNRNCRANHQRKKCQLQRRRIALENNLPHRRLKLEGLSKITASQLPQVTFVLNVQRQIETQRVTKLHQFSRRCSLAEHLFDGVAWHDVDHQKDQRQHQPQRGQREQETLEKVSRHALLPPRNPPPRLSNLWCAAPLPVRIPMLFLLPEPSAGALFLLEPRVAHPPLPRQTGSFRIRNFRRHAG